MTCGEFGTWNSIPPLTVPRSGNLDPCRNGDFNYFRGFLRKVKNNLQSHFFKKVNRYSLYIYLLYSDKFQSSTRACTLLEKYFEQSWARVISSTSPLRHNKFSNRVKSDMLLSPSPLSLTLALEARPGQLLPPLILKFCKLFTS